MATINSAKKLKLLRDGAPIHGLLKFKFDNISVRPSHIDRVVKGIYEDLEAINATSFTSLPDTPETYSGDALKIIRINAGETGLEFVSLSKVALSNDYNDLDNLPAEGNGIYGGSDQVPTGVTATLTDTLDFNGGQVGINGGGATSATYGLKVHNSSGTNNSLVVRDDGFVGMNTGTRSAANELLHINGKTLHTGDVFLNALSYWRKADGVTTGGWIQYNNATSAFEISSHSSEMHFRLNSTALGVMGKFIPSGNQSLGYPTTFQVNNLGANGTNALYRSTEVELNSAYWNGFASVDKSSKITHNTTGASGTSQLDFSIGGTDIATMTDAGFVGIGTTSPIERLSILGNMSVAGQAYSKFPGITVVSGSAVSLDFNDGNGQTIDLENATGDVTINFTNPKAGATYLIKIIQGSTFRDLVFHSDVKFAGQTAPYTLDVTEVNNAIDLVTMFHDGSNYIANFSQNHG